MDIQKYKALTNKMFIKVKPITKPLPKVTEKYLDVEEQVERVFQIFKIKYEKKFQFKSTSSKRLSQKNCDRSQK